MMKFEYKENFQTQEGELYVSDMPTRGFLGECSYFLNKDKLEISYIRVSNYYREQGIARRILKELKERFPRVIYFYGEATKDAKGFWERMGASFIYESEWDELTDEPCMWFFELPVNNLNS